MIPVRSKKAAKRYAQQKSKNSNCTFCEINLDSPQTIEFTKYFKVFKNIYPYDIWDHQTVTDHLLVSPKEHTDTLADLTSPAALEFIRLISAYEQDGYNVYARTPENKGKTIVHQHTHLIKTNNKVIKFILLLNKPPLKWSIK